MWTSIDVFFSPCISPTVSLRQTVGKGNKGGARHMCFPPQMVQILSDGSSLGAELDDPFVHFRMKSPVM